MSSRTINIRHLGLTTSLLSALALVVGCGDPCLDDGLGKGECMTTAASADGTASASETNEGGTATMTDSNEGGTADQGDGDPTAGDGDPTAGDGDPTAGDGDPTGDGDPCENGMQDPGETDVDCGGDCIEVNPNDPNDIEGQCGPGQGCLSIEDCVAGICDPDDECQVCPGDPPAYIPEDLGYNSCQACLLTNCCDSVVMCLTDIPKCVCWFNCVSSTGDVQLCMDTCGNGNIGTVNSCMNSQCKADLNSMNCDAP